MLIAVGVSTSTVESGRQEVLVMENSADGDHASFVESPAIELHLLFPSSYDLRHAIRVLSTDVGLSGPAPRMHYEYAVFQFSSGISGRDVRMYFKPYRGLPVKYSGIIGIVPWREYRAVVSSDFGLERPGEQESTWGELLSAIVNIVVGFNSSTTVECAWLKHDWAATPRFNSEVSSGVFCAYPWVFDTISVECGGGFDDWGHYRSVDLKFL